MYSSSDKHFHCLLLGLFEKDLIWNVKVLFLSFYNYPPFSWKTKEHFVESKKDILTNLIRCIVKVKEAQWDRHCFKDSVIYIRKIGMLR